MAYDATQQTAGDDALQFSKKDVERIVQERVKHLKKDPETPASMDATAQPAAPVAAPAAQQSPVQSSAPTGQPQAGGQGYDPQDISNMNNHISKGIKEDPEFAQLAKSGLPIPNDRLLYLTKALGEDALPLIKEALKDPKTNQELNQHGDTGSLIAWAVKKNKDIQNNTSSPDAPTFSPKPDALNAGTAASNLDEDSQWRSNISKKYK